jgi:sulfopyruvate decarboxylase subunit alpha
MKLTLSTFLSSVCTADRFDYVIVVPASGAAAFYEQAASRQQVVFATSEEEAIAIASGITLGQGRATVCMQQSGVGNCLNTVFTLADAYALMFPILVLDRGRRDDNEVQRVSSVRTETLLNTLGAQFFLMDSNGMTACAERMAAKERWSVVCLS